MPMYWLHQQLYNCLSKRKKYAVTGKRADITCLCITQIQILIMLVALDKALSNKSTDNILSTFIFIISVHKFVRIWEEFSNKLDKTQFIFFSTIPVYISIIISIHLIPVSLATFYFPFVPFKNKTNNGMIY